MEENKKYELYDVLFPQMLATGAATNQDKAYYLKLSELCTKHGISFMKFYQVTIEIGEWLKQYTEVDNSGRN